MAYFLQLLINGIHNAALYALLAYGYVLIHGLTHRTDLSLGALFAFSGQTFILATAFGWTVLWMTLPLALGFGLAVAAVYVGLGGYAIARLIYTPLEAGNRNTILVATLGLSIFLMELSRLAADTRDYWLPPMLAEPVHVLGAAVDISLTQIQLVNIGVALIVIASGELIMQRTHLAGKAGVVTGAAQMMGIGRNIRGEFGGIVIDAGAGRQLPGHQRGAGRGAERRCRIGVGKAGRTLRQRTQMRGMDEIGRTVRKQGSVQLVDHQDENIRSCHWHAPAAANFVVT